MEESTHHEHIDAWLKSLQEELKRKDTRKISGHTVFKVPRQLHDVHPQAYDPLVLAIGPYRKSRRLQPSLTENHVRISAIGILLSQHNLGPEDLEKFSRKVVHDTAELISQYERAPPYENEDILRALFALDASFIVCFLVYLGSAACMNADFVLKMSGDLKLPRRLMDSIIRDILLLENQVPLELLNRVVSVSAAVEEDVSEDFRRCINFLISRVNPFHLQTLAPNGPIQVEYLKKDHKHLLDCLYNSITREVEAGGEGGESYSREFETKSNELDIEENWAVDVEMQVGLLSTVESAVHLRRAGIKFWGCPGANVLSINFDERSATLYLPQIKIVPETESLLRNLAAYEIVALQRAELGSYLALMDDLIDTAEDVRILRGSGVICHSLRNDNEVAELWNSMCKNLQVLYESAALKKAYRGIKTHLKRKSQYKKLWELYADFSSRYLAAPWLTASVLAATLLLLLTLMQTAYSAATYYNNNSSNNSSSSSSS